MQESVELILKKLKNAKFVGYTSAYTDIDYSSLASIEKDNVVYLADTSGDSYFTKEDDGKFPHPLTWLLEDINSGIK